MKHKVYNRTVLKNKISKDQFLVGKNSILELFDKYYDDFEFIVVPNSFGSDKIEKIVAKAAQYRVRVVRDKSLLDYVENQLDIDTSGVVVALKRNIGTYYSLKEIRSLLEGMDKCTCVAFYDIDYEQNLGAMFRTCLALNVDFVLVSHKQQKVFSATVTKVSMGYNYLMPIVRENFLLSIDELKKMGFDVIGLDMEGENLQEMRYNSKVCFVVGNEGKGVSSTALKKCTKIASIPMNNAVESLNVSTSLGITLYDRNLKLTRQ